MADASEASAGAGGEGEAEKAAVLERILSLCSDFPDGLSDKVLQNDMPEVDPKVRAKCINQLLSSGKIDLFKSKETGGLLYKLKSKPTAAASSSGGTVRGDTEEKLVYQIIKEAGNKGTWIRDIRFKSNLVQVQLNKVLKSLENKKHIKVVKCVNASRKKVYMLYELEPDRSVTGGAWYTEQDFDSELAEVLNQQAHRYLKAKLERAKERSSDGPLAVRSMSLVTAKEVGEFIKNLGIVKVDLDQGDIEAILDTLVYDGKAEKTAREDIGQESVRLYRAVEPLLPPTGLVRVPCGVCPVMKVCSETRGNVGPLSCQYLSDWLS